MKTTRVVLMDMRPRLRDIIADALAEEPDLDLLDWQPAEPDQRDVTPDVVVCQAVDPLDPSLPTRLLQSAPRGRVVVVAEKGDRAAIFELRPTRTVMRSIGMQDLIAAIRSGIDINPNAVAGDPGAG
jgi:DNA-binding NarL/FixJ family response regulator